MKNIGSFLGANGLKILGLGVLGLAYLKLGPEVAKYVSEHWKFANNPSDLSGLGKAWEHASRLLVHVGTQGGMVFGVVKGGNYVGKYANQTFNNAPSIAE